MDTKFVLHVLDYVFYVIVVTCAVIGNSLVVISIVKFEYLRSNANFFVGSLAISDLMMAATWIIIQGKKWLKFYTLVIFSEVYLKERFFLLCIQFSLTRTRPI